MLCSNSKPEKVSRVGNDKEVYIIFCTLHSLVANLKVLNDNDIKYKLS